MTAHRCCPECGAELTADGGKFCGCVGPFTAERVDPMHIRPYVDLPEPEDEGSQAPDLEPFARCGQGETAELPALRPYEDPYPGSYEDPHQDPHQDRYEDRYQGVYADSRAEEPDESAPTAAAPLVTASSASRGGSHRRRKGRGAYVYGQEEGPGKRRRPVKAALAAAGAVAALGAGLLTTQGLTSDGGGDRNLSADDTAVPDDFNGGPTEDPSRTKEGNRDKKPSAKQTSRTGAASSRADRDGGDRAERAPAPSRTSPSSSSAPGTSGSPDDDGGRDGGWDGDWNGGWGGGSNGGWGGGGHNDGDRPRPPQESTQPGGETLRPGDRGPEVAELQRRLKQAGALDESAPEDGTYSQQVQQAVARYQARNEVRGDDFGEYGPNTRRALEAQTSG